MNKHCVIASDPPCANPAPMPNADYHLRCGNCPACIMAWRLYLLKLAQANDAA